jgi:hypothetical protein
MTFQEMQQAYLNNKAIDALRERIHANQQLISEYESALELIWEVDTLTDNQGHRFIARVDWYLRLQCTKLWMATDKLKIELHELKSV